ncbi:MAG: OmpA family protein [Cytophagales bacterium]|nr:OmpA family protein [Cytophagales bacterium]MDW8383442.1 OmpA family protein [Flammeovirgaceae bacterium]
MMMDFIRMLFVLLYFLPYAYSQKYISTRTLVAEKSGGIQNLRFSPDGKWIAGAGRNGDVYVWEVESGNLKYRLKGHVDGLTEVTFSKSGRLLGSSSADGSVRVWNMKDGSLEGVYLNEPFMVFDPKKPKDTITLISVSFVVFSPDEQYVLFGGDNGYVMKAQLGKNENGKPQKAKRLASTNPKEGWYTTITGGCITPDEKHLIVSVGNYLPTINIETGQITSAFLYPHQALNDVAEGPDKNSVASWSYDGKVTIWSYPKGDIIKQIQASKPENYSGAAFSSDGKYLITGVWDNHARVWDWKKDSVVAILEGHTAIVRICRANPKNPQMFATASYDGTIRIWEPETVISQIKFQSEVATPGKAFELKKIQFQQSSYELLADYYDELDEIVKILQKNPYLKIRIHGHTDNVGNPMLNKTLSERRAITVKNYLTERGIDKDRIETIGYGGERPRYDNSTESGRSKNRRIEIEFLY